LAAALKATLAALKTAVLAALNALNNASTGFQNANKNRNATASRSTNNGLCSFWTISGLMCASCPPPPASPV
jgi:hypothetical protein